MIAASDQSVVQLPAIGLALSLFDELKRRNVHPSLDLVPNSSLDHLQTPNNLLLARLASFSLHVATVCEAHQRSRLERLCRYVARPEAAPSGQTSEISASPHMAELPWA
jgi:hypothetical protein